MRYLERPPDPRLAPYVASLWALSDAPGSPAPPGPDPILPDGCTEIVVNRGGLFRRHHPDGKVEVQARALVVGQMTGPAAVEPSGRVDLVGARFRPAGMYALLRVPQHELAGSILDLGAVWPTLARGAAPIGDAAPGIEAIAALEAALLGSLGPAIEPDRVVSACVASLLRSGGRVTVDELARASGLGARHLRRCFLREVGLGPKLLGRIVRFQEALRAAASEDGRSWVEIALDHGYYDQSHLVRDFREFAGRSPASRRGDGISARLARRASP